MKKGIYSTLIFLVSFSLQGCDENSDRQKFVELSSFSLDSTAIQDNDEVRLIYCSSGGEDNTTLDFFVQYVAVKVNSKDTINIMTNHNLNVSSSDGDKVFVYKKRYNKDFSNVIKAKNGFGKAMNGIKSPSVSFVMPMVITDEYFSDIGANNYPTVFGDISLK